MHNKIRNVWLFTTLLFVTTSAGAEDVATKKVEMKCGQYNWSLICGASDSNTSFFSCARNTLNVQKGKKEVVITPPAVNTKAGGDAHKPRMFKDSTPRSISCIENKSGSYIQVMYARDETSVGMFLELFTSDGKRLTQIGVPIKQGLNNPFNVTNPDNLPKIIRIEDVEDKK